MRGLGGAPDADSGDEVLFALELGEEVGALVVAFVVADGGSDRCDLLGLRRGDEEAVAGVHGGEWVAGTSGDGNGRVEGVCSHG